MKKHELENLTPIWNKEMGDRFQLIRMKLHFSQDEMSEVLAISRSSISKIERGAVSVALVPLSVLKFAFGDHLTFILYNSGSERYNRYFIRTEYWKRLKRGSKYGSNRTAKEMADEIRKGGFHA